MDEFGITRKMNKVAIQLLPDKSDMTSYDVIVTSYFYIFLRKWYCWPANVSFCTKMSPLCNCTYDNNEVFGIRRKRNSYPIIIKKVIWQIMTSYWRHTSQYPQRKWYCWPTNLRFWEKKNISLQFYQLYWWKHWYVCYKQQFN